MSWNQNKSNLPKTGEGDQHLLAKQFGAEFVKQHGYLYRYEYPIKIGEYVHTFDVVFWKPSTLQFTDGTGYERKMDMQYVMEYSNEDLIKLKFKHLIDEQIEIVLEIDDYQGHTHTEQLINAGEAEAAAKKVFAKPLLILRFKKEEIVTDDLKMTELADQYMTACWVNGQQTWDSS